MSESSKEERVAMEALADLVAALTTPPGYRPDHKWLNLDYPAAMWRGLTVHHPALKQAQVVLAKSTPPAEESPDARAIICALPRRTPPCAHEWRTSCGGRAAYFCKLRRPECEHADPIAPPTIEAQEPSATICTLRRGLRHGLPSCAQGCTTGPGGRAIYFCHSVNPATCRYALPAKEADADHD